MKKRILVIADGRSPITLRWLETLEKLDFEINLVSTYPVDAPLAVKSLHVMPLGFTRLSGSGNKQDGNPSGVGLKKVVRRFIQAARPFILKVRSILGPATLPKYERALLKLIEEINPDIVHALRIPFEGMLARVTPPQIPLVVSIWGNDFTLHANSSRQMRQLTRAVMERADGLLADVERDLALGKQWGFPEAKPALCVPGGGGIHFDEIEKSQEVIPTGIDFDRFHPVIINPRGIRAYAQTDTFFKAIPLVLEKLPNALFLCAAMQDKPEAVRWYHRLQLEKNVRLLPLLTQTELWSLFHRSQISLSITTHDGTPNTLIEAMACGCFPITGDIESIREWITPGVNGYLVPPKDHEKLAQAIIETASNDTLISNAKTINQALLRQSADADLVAHKLQLFYNQIIKPH